MPNLKNVIFQIEFLRGNPSGFEDGLVDVDEDMYEASVSSLKEIWNNRELPFNNPPRFYDWFIACCENNHVEISPSSCWAWKSTTALLY